MSSFIAAGTAYASHGINMIPFFIFYSMFGFQRIGDLIWAAGDIQARGFLLGGTAGRTTLHGEGLQHQDGHSHAYAYALPNMKAYDPAFAYELAVIIKEGINRMFVKQEDLFYYLTVMNETYKMPKMPEGSEEGILKGIYRFSKSSRSSKSKVHLFGSGTIINEVIKAQKILEEEYDVSADVWSVTSFNELRRDGLEVERVNRLNPGAEQQRCYVQQCLGDREGPYIAATDYMKAVPDQIRQWVPGRFVVLGTDGFGRSDARAALRSHFEVDRKHIALAALKALADDGKLDYATVNEAIKKLGIDPKKPDPVGV